MKILLAIVTFFMSIIAPFNSIKSSETQTADFEPVIRFAVASDSHVQTAPGEKASRMQKVISLGYDVAGRDKSYNNLDAVAFVGDLTDGGNRVQFIDFLATVNSVINKDETKLLAVVAKSHDGSSLGKKSLAYYEKLTGMPADFHYIINGFHFIGISSSKTEGDVYSEYQREWVKTQLDLAVKDNPSAPVFVMHHEHVSQTVYGSKEEDGWGIDYFKDIFEKYPQIVHFSGHSHYPLNDPRSIWQGEFTAIGTGALKYAELTVDGVSRIHPENYKKIAQFWIVEVDKDNTLRLRGYDALSGTLLVEYYINNPADPHARQYTEAQQKGASSAPEFEKEAALKVKKIGSKYKITTPAAKSTDGKPVFLYRFYIYDESGKEISSSYTVNNYWLADTYNEITQKAEVEKGYTVKVTAENAYGMKSEPLEYKF